jgi:hypothetical protein
VSQKNDDVYVYYGSSSWSGQENTPDVTFDESSITEDNGIEGFGMSLAVGNYNYDGTSLNFDDLLIGAPEKNIGTGNDANNWDGVVYAFGSVFASTEIVEDHLLRPVNNKDKGEFGFSIACGYIDSDSKADVIIGEPMLDSQDGQVNVFYGADIGAVEENPADYIPVVSSGEKLGFSVAVGDMDTDSYADVLVGAPLNDEGGADIGRAYVFQANTDGSGITDGATPDMDLAGPSAGSQFGFNVTVGDFYGDGQGDAIVSAAFNHTSDYGAVFIYDDPVGGNNVTDDIVDGNQANEYLGWSLDGGRFANDTAFVLAAGAPDWDDASPTETDAGRVMVMIIPEFDNRTFPVFISILVPTIGWILRRHSARTRNDMRKAGTTSQA